MTLGIRVTLLWRWKGTSAAPLVGQMRGLSAFGFQFSRVPTVASCCAKCCCSTCRRRLKTPIYCATYASCQIFRRKTCSGCVIIKEMSYELCPKKVSPFISPLHDTRVRLLRNEARIKCRDADAFHGTQSTNGSKRMQTNERRHESNVCFKRPRLVLAVFLFAANLIGYGWIFRLSTETSSPLYTGTFEQPWKITRGYADMI